MIVTRCAFDGGAPVVRRAAIRKHSCLDPSAGSRHGVIISLIKYWRKIYCFFIGMQPVGVR